jgi:hypothetical protein
MIFIQKTFQIKEKISLKIFNQNIMIKTDSLEDIKEYSNAKIQDIFLDPEKLLSNISMMPRPKHSTKLKQEETSQEVNQHLENSSNFVVFTTSIEKEEVDLSLESMIEDKLIIIIIQKLPPHLEDVQTLQPKEIIEETTKITFSVLVGKCH